MGHHNMKTHFVQKHVGIAFSPESGLEGSPCRTCSLIVTVSRWKTTSGGFRRGGRRNSATGGAPRAAAGPRLAAGCVRESRVRSCDNFPVHLCHVLLCHHCTWVHFRRALESEAKRCFHICHHVGLHRFAHCALNQHWWWIRLLLISLINESRLVPRKRACLFHAVTGGEEIYLRPSDPPLFQFHCGAMASSAVSSVLCLRDAAGNYAETRTGACIYYGDAARFHEWEFRTRW